MKFFFNLLRNSYLQFKRLANFQLIIAPNGVNQLTAKKIIPVQLGCVHEYHGLISTMQC